MSADHKIEVKRETRDGGVVAHVIYDYARRLNVLNPASLKELTETFLALAKEDALRVVVFSGAGGKAFIGGADINHMAAMRHPDDKPTIGLLLCRSTNKVVVEYALRNLKRPIGVAEWQTKLVDRLPRELKGRLPSIAELERELGK